MRKIFNFQFPIPNSKKGFTLIELLIVIAIIGVLSALLMSNFIGVRQRARDAQRKSDLRQIQSALEIYRSDNGVYPTTLYANTCPTLSALKFGSTTYMAKISCDPLYGNYSYSSLDSGQTYSLIACLENSNDSQKDDSVDAYCSGKTTTSYTLASP